MRRVVSALGFRSRRGSVIVVVLVTLIFAALLLTRIIESASPDLLIAMRQADRERLRADAYSALETTLAVLMDFRVVDGGLYAPAQGWADPLGYAGYAPREGVTIAVDFEDESAKLSLPALTPDTLELVLEQLGLEKPEAARVADAMFVWMHQGHAAVDSSAGASAYERGDPPATPPLRPLRSYGELASILVARDHFFDADGRPTPLFDAFKQTVSLYRFNGTNVNSAGETALRAAGWDDRQSQTLRKHLDVPTRTNSNRPYLRSVQEARQVAGNPAMQNLGVQVQVLRVNVTAREGAAQLTVSALVTWPGVASLPGVAPGGPQEQTRTNRGPTGVPAAGDSAANSLRYPYTVLEVIETTLPAPLTPTDAPAA